MAHHKVKSFVGVFPYLVSGAKTSETRFDDRNYCVDDTVTFQEGQLEGGEFVYTGREITGKISHIDSYGCQEGFVNLSLKDMGLLLVEG